MYGFQRMKGRKENEQNLDIRNVSTRFSTGGTTNFFFGFAAATINSKYSIQQGICTDDYG